MTIAPGRHNFGGDVCEVRFSAVGRAVPLAFALATVGVLLIAYPFVRLCQRFHHAGSVYGFVGATLPPHSAG